MLVKKDVYDENGVLLIAKGNSVDEQSPAIAKLRYLGLFDLVEAQDAVDGLVAETINLKEAIGLFNQKFDKFDEKVFKVAIDIVDGIIYDCKNKLWYSHFSVLSHYTSWTYSHSINTALISCMIGIGLKYTHDELIELTTGAILHDLGMMLVPKSILLKEGALATHERLLINGHCEVGEAMVADTGLSKAVRDVIRQHHERNDGSGYPSALTGEEISDYAKIVSVACFFDSATSYRPYKESKTSHQVLQEMEENFDKYEKKVVAALRDYLG